MAAISDDEKLRRQHSVASNLGTHAMENLFPDAATLTLLRRFEEGDLTLDQFSEAMDAHAYGLIAARRTFAGAA